MNLSTMSARRITSWALSRVMHQRHVTAAAETNSSETTVSDYLWSGCLDSASRTALVCGETGRTLSYGRLHELTQKVSRWLSANVRRSDGLALILPNCLEFAVAGLAAFHSGVVLCPVDPAFKTPELTRFLRTARPGCVITHTLKIPDVLEAKRLLEAEEEAEFPLTIVAVDDRLKFNRILHLDEIAEAELPQSTGARPAPEDTALLLMGAGGPMKISNANFVANCRQLGLPELSSLRRDPQSGVAALLPSFHGYGLTGLLVGGLHRGARIVTFPKFGLEDFLGSLKEREVSVLSTDSTTLRRLTASPGAVDELIKVESVTVEGGTVPLTDLTRLMEILPAGAEVSREYGLPEGPVLFRQPRGTKKLSSVGKPLPRTEAAVLDPSTGETLPDRREGEIIARGPQVPADCPQHERGGGWVSTGDLGYFDKDGFFYVTGRLRDTVRLGGLEVSPSELEQVLGSHPEVADCGLFWKSIGQDGDIAVAVVVASRPAQPPSPKELSDFLAARVAPYKRVTSVVFSEHIPRFSDGRIDRKRLAEDNGVRVEVEFVAPTYI